MWCDTLTKTHSLLLFIYTVVGIDSLTSSTADCNCPSELVQNARCSKQTDCKVICDDGYWGKDCQYGRIRLTSPQGYITDGDKSYSKSSKRMWLIDTGYRVVLHVDLQPNASIHFRIEEFSTECNWDHLYIFDGDSTDSPLLAAFNGHLLGDVNSASFGQIPQEIIANSGSAYIYFYSDLAAVQSGFNISYSIIRNCSCTNGRCTTAALCVCNVGWTGSHCDVRKNCSSSCKNGVCNQTLGSCICSDGFTGADCSQPVTSSYWTRLNVENSDDEISARSSHTATVIGNNMWVYNGFRFSNTKKQNNLYRYNLKNKTWRSLPSGERHFTWGHSMISYQNKLIIFGGERDHTILNRLLAFDTNSSEWIDMEYSSVAVTGHTATLVDNKMIVIFGLSTDGLFPGVQEYDFGKSKWQVIENNSALNTARHGHTSVYDPFSKIIYVYGGTTRTISSNAHPLDSLMAYHPHSRKWTTLTSSKIPTTLHSAVIIDHMMIVFGGNPYNGQKQKNIICHTSKLQVYDLACQRWHSEDLPKVAQTLARYGHTAVTKERTMYVFGGFNGALFKDILTYTHGECNRILNESECVEKYFSAGCYWNNSLCVNKDSLETLPQCPGKHQKFCSEIESCDECSMTPKCGWADESCQVNESNTCPMPSKDICPLYFNCNSCKKAGCYWNNSKYGCQRQQNNNNDCSTPCSDRKTLTNCLPNTPNQPNPSCLWCENLQRCVDAKLYVVHYPYGQCFEWINSADQGATCQNKTNCQDCLTLPSCGWNEDSMRNGAGECLTGGAAGPKNALNWHFFDCPLCQCNGHSSCAENSSVCINCGDHTAGENCQICAPGYFGDPKDGGKCQRCECNGHADTCDESGFCKCNMKGVEGNYCDKCSANNYVGNATNGGFCYYHLSPDYLYKINVSDRTIFNFICSPAESDKNTIVTVNILKGNPLNPAFLNISVGSDTMRETYLLTNVALSSQYEEKFSKDSFPFGSDKFHFKIYVYNMKPFSLVSVSVHQPHDSGINLLKFFIIFLGCFVGLLLFAVIFWKAKIYCDSFRRTRRRNVELVYMTNRPFASVPIFVEKPGHVPMKAKPLPLTSEICYGNKAAVVTVLVRLPLCAQAENSAGVAALCLGSTLVSCNEPQGSKMVNYMKNIKRRRNPFRSSPSGR